MELIKHNTRPSLFRDIWGNIFNELEFNDTNNANPKTNIRENESNIIIELMLPGFNKEEVVIEFEDNELRIYSNLNDVDENEEQNYIRRSFAKLGFNKVFRLPNSIEEKKISGKFNEGILSVNIPKTSKNKIRKQITIS